MKTEYLLIIILIFILIKITRIAKIVSSKHLFKYILYQVNKNKVYNVLKIKLIFLFGLIFSCLFLLPKQQKINIGDNFYRTCLIALYYLVV